MKKWQCIICIIICCLMKYIFNEWAFNFGRRSGNISISLEVVETVEHLIVIWNNYVRYS